MSGRVVDLSQHSRQRRQSANGHAPKQPIPATRLIPTYPDLDIDLIALASQQHRASDLPATAEGRLRIVVNPDDTWEVAVVRFGEDHPLLLRGAASARTPRTLREIVCWLFGVPA